MNKRPAFWSKAKWSNLPVPVGSAIVCCSVSGGVVWVCAEEAPSDRKSTIAAVSKFINCFLEWSLFVVRIPAQSEGKGRLIVFPLGHVLRAPVIETEDFVVHVQSRGEHREALGDVIGSLCVHLGVGVEVVVAIRSRRSIGDCSRPGALVLIGIDIRAVVRYTHGYQGALGGVGRPDVPGERCLANKLRRIGAVGKVVVLGVCVGEVGDDTRRP